MMIVYFTSLLPTPAVLYAKANRERQSSRSQIVRTIQLDHQ